MRNKKKPSRGNAGKSARAWKNEKVYFNGDDYFRDLLKSIRKAKKSLDFETYIFEAGWLGDRVVKELLRAAKRGVKVRVLVDGVGSPDFISHYGPRLEKAGVPFKVYRSWPVFFSSVYRFFHLKGMGQSLHHVHRLFNRAKHRDHRKLCVVDENLVWIGSFNVSDWHLKSIKGKGAWRDTGLRLSGVSSPAFRLAFLIAWEDPWPRQLRDEHRRSLKLWLSRELKESSIRLTLTRRLRSSLRRELSDRFRAARKKVWVLTPYFSPTFSLWRAIDRAGRRGCDVRLILPGSSDVPMARWASFVYYPSLLKAGCRIYEYRKSILHGKAIYVDDWIMIGSSNLNQRSLRKDLEVNVIPQDSKSIRALEGQFEKDLEDCGEITAAELKARPLWERVLAWFFFRFRFWF